MSDEEIAIVFTVEEINYFMALITHRAEELMTKNWLNDLLGIETGPINKEELDKMEELQERFHDAKHEAEGTDPELCKTHQELRDKRNQN